MEIGPTADATLEMDAEGHDPRVSKLDLPVASLETLSHELRTPLTPILGYLDALLAEEAGQLTDAQRQYLEIVQRNAKRLARIAAEITFLAKEDAHESAAGPF
jgi:signal transduction histidine kinase